MGTSQNYGIKPLDGRPWKTFFWCCGRDLCRSIIAVQISTVHLSESLVKMASSWDIDGGMGGMSQLPWNIKSILFNYMEWRWQQWSVKSWHGAFPRSIENQSCISRYKSKICGLKYSIYLGHFGTFWDIAPQCDMDHIANIFILHIFNLILCQCCLLHYISHMLHGAGIFTYKTGWFGSGKCRCAYSSTMGCIWVWYGMIIYICMFRTLDGMA
jgi:hypothetical protein